MQSAVQQSESAQRDFRADIREVHLQQAKAWQESQVYCLPAAKQRFDAGNDMSASVALMISDTSAHYAEEEEKAAAALVA